MTLRPQTDASTAPARLIALDWGTTNLRALLLDEAGDTIAQRHAPTGILNVQQGQFEAALRSLCADWLSDPSLVVMASGMIGSRQGWIEAPYLQAPTTPGAAAAALTRVQLSHGAELHLIPGIACINGMHAEAVDDVMRGEETQVWGADLPDGATVILPGTHSKWVRCGPAGAILGCRTWMTGELFAVLSQHSILGRLMTSGEGSAQAFELGATRGLHAPELLSTLLFSVRTAGLMNRIEPHALSDYLSGLLIGAEVAAGQRDGSLRAAPADQRHASRQGMAAQTGPGVHLVGEPALCARYAAVLGMAGERSVTLDGALAARGAWRIANAAGLLQPGRR